VIRDFLRRTELFFSRPEFQESGKDMDTILAQLAGTPHMNPDIPCSYWRDGRL
jgi:hypothetical protein